LGLYVTKSLNSGYIDRKLLWCPHFLRAARIEPRTKKRRSERKEGAGNDLFDLAFS